MKLDLSQYLSYFSFLASMAIVGLVTMAGLDIPVNERPDPPIPPYIVDCDNSLKAYPVDLSKSAVSAEDRSMTHVTMGELDCSLPSTSPCPCNCAVALYVGEVPGGNLIGNQFQKITNESTGEAIPDDILQWFPEDKVLMIYAGDIKTLSYASLTLQFETPFTLDAIVTDAIGLCILGNPEEALAEEAVRKMFQEELGLGQDPA